MSLEYPPIPPRDQMRFEDGELIARLAEPDDASALFALLTNPALPFLLDEDRPESAERYQNAFVMLREQEEAREPANSLYWVVELNGQPIGMLNAQLRFLDKNGTEEGTLLRCAVWLAYLDPAQISQGVGGRIQAHIEGPIEQALMRHFGIEYFVFWADDENEIIRGIARAVGFEGPINHNKQGLGFYRRPCTR